MQSGTKTPLSLQKEVFTRQGDSDKVSYYLRL